MRRGREFDQDGIAGRDPAAGDHHAHDPGLANELAIRGTGKDGGPNCATVRLLGEWQVIVGRKDSMKYHRAV